MNQKDLMKQPFFAKLLEAQKTSSEKGGQQFIFTLKILDDIEHTQKYPSDNDEI
jgi:hypothetical protein